MARSMTSEELTGHENPDHKMEWVVYLIGYPTRAMSLYQISLRFHHVCVALQLVLTPRFSYRELADLDSSL